MQIHEGTKNLPRFHNAVVTVGSFDGVHLGHRRIFEYVREGAKRHSGESVVITFWPHPQTVLHPERPFFLINTEEENAEWIEEEGIDHLIVVPFTKEFAQCSFQDFLIFLIKEIGIKAIVMGPDHNFGHNREGNRETMREICSKYSVEIIIIPELILEENKVRSSEIRQCIGNKDFTKAEKLLGHPLKKNKQQCLN